MITRIVKKVKRHLDDASKKRELRFFNNKAGIEIGGPSAVFANELPIYPVVSSLDGCNFSSTTVWEGNIEQGNNYKYYQGKTGFQFISEASDLKEVKAEAYDFLLACHCLEHCANVLKTMKEWMRVVKPGGCILLILPDRNYTFDHKRPVTTLQHLIDDLEKGVDENDLTHLDEILSLHDLSKDLAAGDFERFKNRSLDNIHNRCLHHHVFDFELLKQIFEYLNLKVKYTKFIAPFHQVIAGVK